MGKDYSKVESRLDLIVVVIWGAFGAFAFGVLMTGLFFIHWEIQKLRKDILILSNYQTEVSILSKENE